MRLRNLVFFAAVGCAFAQTQESTKTAKIEEIFRITKVDAMQKQMMGQIQAMTSAQIAQAGGSPEAQEQGRVESQKVLEMVSKEMGWEKLKPLMVKMYDETFTENEISGLLMFYQSDAGTAMLTKMPALMTKMMALVQDRLKALTPENREDG